MTEAATPAIATTATPSHGFLLSVANVLFFGILGGIFSYFIGVPTAATSTTSTAIDVDSNTNPFPYKQTTIVTAVYFLFFYLAIFYQSMIGLTVWNEMKVKYCDDANKKKDDDDDTKKKRPPTLWEVKYGPTSYKDRRIVASNRIVGNTLEQMPMFLIGLWLLAIIIVSDPNNNNIDGDYYASRCGWFYVIFRSIIYPLLYIYNPALVVLATIPNYAIIAYVWITIIRVVY